MKLSRRTISIRRDTYAKLLAYCQARGESVSGLVERNILAMVGTQAPAVLPEPKRQPHTRHSGVRLW